MALHPSRKGEGWGTHSLREAASPLGRGSHGFEGFGEVFREGLLGFGREFFVVAGEVEDVNGGFAFRVDERDFDVALMGREGERDLAQEAGHVLRDHLQKSGV